MTCLLRGVCVWKWGGGGECGDGVGGGECGDGVGGGYVHGVGEEKFIDGFAYPFAWGLHIMCRYSLQKDRGWGDVFIEGCVCGNGRRGGCGDGVGGGGGGGYVYGVGEEKVIDDFAYRGEPE